MIEWKGIKNGNCVVVPVHNEDIGLLEQASFIQCVRVFGKNRDIFIVGPESMDFTGYLSLAGDIKVSVKRFSDEFFKSIASYNELCKRWEFYDAFRDYEYMLIYQLDCWAFEDRIDYFAGLGYDYFGAPWFEQDKETNNYTITRCGNGGFSLRKIDRMIEVCKESADEADDGTVPEDVFFSTRCNVCPVEVGARFSFEVGPNFLFKVSGGQLPMGCHKPFAFGYKEFWKDYIKFK